MLAVSLSFCFGAATINLWPYLVPKIVLLSAASCAAVIVYKRKRIFNLVAWFCLGCCWAQWSAWQLPWFNEQFHNQRIELETSGYIASIAEKQERSIRFLLQTKKGLFYLNWYGAYHDMKPGEYWHLKFRLIPVKNYDNETGFDLTRWLMLKDVHAKGYVLNAASNQKLSDSGYHKYPILRYRYEKQQQLKKQQIKNWEIISALTLGLRNAMSDEYWTLLRKTNTSHLLAISGLHIGMISGMVFTFLRYAWSLVPWLTTRIPAPIFASGISLCAAFAYALIAGWSYPTQRAFIMIAVVLIAVMRRSPVFTWYSFAVALFLVLCVQPLAVMTVSFALSFLAAFSLIYVLSQRRRIKHVWLQTQLAVTLFLFPWTLIFFKELALVGWLVNLIAIPLVSFLILPASLLGVFTQNHFCLSVASVLIDYLLKLLALFSNLPLMSWYNPQHSFMVLALAVLGLLIVLLPRGIPGKYLGVFMLLPVLTQRPIQLSENQLYLQFLDVHHGLATVIRTQTHTLLYDIGEPFITKSVLIPFLQQQGISAIDKVVISHPDYDHLGAINVLHSFYPQAKLESSDYLYAQASTQLCEKGQKWLWDGVRFEYLHPDAQRGSGSKNDRSCVLQIRVGAQSVLLTGDISSRAETKLLPSVQPQTILLVPHHGSSTSSSARFLKKVQPQIAVISTHRPSSELKLQRYRQREIRLLSTHEQGQIDIKLNQATFFIESYRQKWGRLWYDSSLKKKAVH